MVTATEIESRSEKGCRDIQHNDNYDNGIQSNGIRHTDMQRNDTQHRDFLS